MILQILSWWILSWVLGLIAWPLTFRLFHRLPDRGHSFSRPIGILMAGFILWLGASYGVLENGTGGAVAAVIGVASLSLIVGRGHWSDMGAWIRNHRRALLSMEVLFVVSFILWSVVRAHNPTIQHTEKPMELAFLNSIQRSRTFPPPDPWLSGYSISYYYFGYVLLSLLTSLSGWSTGVVFNLGNALWFAMTALGSYGILFNLLSIRSVRERIFAPLLAPVFVLITGNLEAVLDVLWSRRIFWRELPDGSFTSAFWDWLNIKQLSESPLGEISWIPQRHLWWWRGSRVVRDVNLAGVDVEVIDEFPMFSFLLADNHPHLLALPFTLVAVGFVLHLFLDKPGVNRNSSPLMLRSMLTPWFRRVGAVAAVLGLVVMAGEVIAGETVLEAATSGLLTAAAGTIGLVLLGVTLGIHINRVPSALTTQQIWFAGWLFGGLAFLNVWDSPIYFSLLVVILLWSQRGHSRAEAFRKVVPALLSIVGLALLLYLPWLISFTSQAGGILPNLIYPTQFQHFWVMFGVSLIPILVWLLSRIRDLRADAFPWRTLFGVTIGTLFTLVGIAALLSLSLYLYISVSQPGGLTSVFLDLGIDPNQSPDPLGNLMGAAFERRLSRSWTALLVAGLIAVSYMLISHWGAQRESADQHAEQGGKAEAFTVMLVGIGSLLILTPEFIYLKDLFGTRMNTVFKFYFAAWTLWGLAAAYATVELWTRKGPVFTTALRRLVVIPLILGLLYPTLSIWTKTNGFNPDTRVTLDGTAYLADLNPEDHSAIDWINSHLAWGTIAEAVGGSYTEYARISAHTGFPTVLGWEFHEVQWRGSADLQGSRAVDIARLYETSDPIEAETIMNLYDLDYVYIGHLERITYQPLKERKFAAFLDLVYQQGDVRIYARRNWEFR